MTTARAETSEQRLSIYRGLVARNRLISLLRLALPVAGLAAFGWFAVHILLASLGGADEDRGRETAPAGQAHDVQGSQHATGQGDANR